MAGSKENRPSGKAKLDLGTVGGLVLAIGGIVGGYLIEHGKVAAILGESAALIVLGGCLGATLVANPMAVVSRAFKRTKDLILQPASDREDTIESLVSFASRARKNGIVSLETEAMEIPDPFMRKALMLAVDGLDLTEIRGIMELEIDLNERRSEEESKVFETAGGFAPTIGIIGAVLGLIIVMGDLSDMNKVGNGIAAAFVATIYGVGSANLLFLPAAHKIKMRASSERERQEMILEGAAAIVEGLNPKMIRAKLEAYSPPKTSPRRAAEDRSAQRAA